MKKLLILLLLMVITISVVSCTKNTDVNMSNNSKSIEKQTKKIGPNVDYLIISETGYDEEGRIDYREYVYDENGNRFLRSVHIQMDDVLDLSINYIHEFKNGMVSCVRSDDGEDVFYYTYDENKKISSKEQYLEGRLYSLFDCLDGNVVKETCYKKDGSILYIKQYEYDGFFNIIKEVEHMPDFPKEHRDISVNYDYFYDENGLKFRCIKSNGERLSYEYDGNGNMIKETTYDKEGRTSYWREYKYIKKEEVNDYIISVNEACATYEIIDSNHIAKDSLNNDTGVKMMDNDTIQAILTGKKSFIDYDSKSSVTITSLPLMNNQYGGIPYQYAVVDLDNNGTKELLIEYNTNGDTAILNIDNGKCIAYYIPYRSRTEIKTDGTVCWSGSASESGVQKLSFSDHGIISTDIIVYSENLFIVNGINVTEEECEQALSEQYKKQDVEWLTI